MIAKKYEYGNLWHARWCCDDDSTAWRLKEAVLLEVSLAIPKDVGVVSAQVLLVLQGKLDPRYKKETFIFSPRYWILQSMLEL